MKRMCLSALALGLFLLAPAWADQPDSAARDATQGQRVFVTAHSFHIFVANRLAPLAKAAGLEKHELVGQQMIGGSRVQQHWDLPPEKNKAKDALTAGKVDVLTMSPNWIIPDEGIEKYVELGLMHNPKLKALVQESWAPWDDWQRGNHVKTNEERDERSLDGLRAAHAKFKETLEKQINELNAKLGRPVICVVPVGDAMLKLRELVGEGKAPGITKHSELFTDTIGHGKAPVLALTTYCNFACIYQRTPVGLDDKDPALDNLHADLRPLLQKLAWEAVIAHPMSGVKAEARK